MRQNFVRVGAAAQSVENSALRG